MLLTTFLTFLVYSSFTNYLYLNRIFILIMIFSLFIFINSFDLIALSPGITLFNNWFSMSANQIPLIILIFIIIILLLLYNTSTNRYPLASPFQSLIMIVNVIALLLFPLTNDLLSIYIIIELQSYSLYILTGLYNRSFNATRAGLLYFLTGGIASTIVLVSAYFIYKTTGSTNLSDIYIFYLYHNDFNHFNILLIALLFKMGIAPLHQWSISVYNYSPTFITAYISIVAKLSIITFIYNNISLFDNSLLIVFFYTSMIIAAYKPLFQVNIKIILAYSGLLNFAYIILSIVTMDISFYIFLIQYSLTHILIFLCLLSANQFINKPISYWSPILFINQLNLPNKTLITILIISFFSLIGIPPLPGFYGKFYLIIDSLQDNYLLETIIIIIFSVIATYFYANIIRTMVKPTSEELNSSLPGLELINDKKKLYIINPSLALIISILFTISLLFYSYLPCLLECLYLFIL